MDELEGVEMLERRQDYWPRVAEIAAQNKQDIEWVEFGVASGRSCKHWLEAMASHDILYAFDSWQGLPEPWDKGNKVMPRGTFAQPIPRFLIDDRRVVVVEGLVEDTLPYPFVAGLALCHIDTDLYSAAATILERVDDYLVDGTVIVFDEMWDNAGGGHYLNWPEGEYKAYQEWMQRSGKTVEWFLQTVGGSAGWVRDQ